MNLEIAYHIHTGEFLHCSGSFLCIKYKIEGSIQYILILIHHELRLERGIKSIFFPLSFL